MIDLKSIYKIRGKSKQFQQFSRIGHDNKGGFAGWYLDNVEVTKSHMKHKLTFIADRWLDTKEGDGKLEIELFPLKRIDIGTYLTRLGQLSFRSKHAATHLITRPHICIWMFSGLQYPRTLDFPSSWKKMILENWISYMNCCQRKFPCIFLHRETTNLQNVSFVQKSICPNLSFCCGDCQHIVYSSIFRMTEVECFYLFHITRDVTPPYTKKSIYWFTSIKYLFNW